MTPGRKINKTLIPQWIEVRVNLLSTKDKRFLILYRIRFFGAMRWLEQQLCSRPKTTLLLERFPLVQRTSPQLCEELKWQESRTRATPSLRIPRVMFVGVSPILLSDSYPSIPRCIKIVVSKLTLRTVLKMHSLWQQWFFLLLYYTVPKKSYVSPKRERHSLSLLQSLDTLFLNIFSISLF
jgi:hypothetical protein